MGIIDNILMALGLLPAKGLIVSMRQSKTLTIMVIVGIIFIALFKLFLFKMAAAQ